MSDAGLLLERLDDGHEVGSFESGRPELDGWLREHALAAQRMDTARTFVLRQGGTIVGYVSLTMGSVHRADAPSALVRGLPGYPVGVVVLARLAIDRHHQGRGLGRRLLAEALRMAVRAGEAAAARLIVVDAIDEAAAAFYRRNGFVSLPEHPARLFRRMKDVRASLDAASAP